jgi:ACS family hexuronate transporter-like MFS transporter
MKKIPHLRWWIAMLLLGAAVLNYIDRQTLSALAPTIQQDLGFNDRDYANVVNLFLVAYTLAYLFSGRIVDRLGTRRGAIIFVAWWSLANGLTAAATSLRTLGIFRFALGLGEAGVWPMASKAVSEWFPPRERALAIGFYTMGATLGATLAPYVVISLAGYPFAERFPFLGTLVGAGLGWRIAFVITGVAGFLWLIPWMLFYRTPAESKLITETERRLLTAFDPNTTKESGEPWTWRQIFTNKIVWLLLLGRLFTDPVWYFFQFWFAKYLHSARQVLQGDLTITWIIYAAAGVGSIAGGWISGKLIAHGRSAAGSRLKVMLGCAMFLPLSPLITRVGNLNLALALSAIVVLASLAWLINISALIVDLIPKHSLGSVFSVIAAGSTLGGIVMNTIVATMVSGPSTNPAGFLDVFIGFVFGPILRLVQGVGYTPWFAIMAILHPFAWLLLVTGKVGEKRREES